MSKNIREISVKILSDVFSKGKNLKVEFENKALHLDTRDSAFLKFSVFGVIRLKKSIDDILSELYSGNYNKVNEVSKNILRLGVFQIHFMNSVPNYAAVNSMVEIAKKQNLKFSKVVNAILNRYIRERKKILINSMRNHSGEIIDQLKSDYSIEDIRRICSWNDQLPITWLRIKENKKNKLSEIFKAEIQKFGQGLNYISVGRLDPQIKAYLEEGILRVQSPGSGLVVNLLNVKNGEKIIDACAAPGGKSEYILELLDCANLVYINDNNKQRYQKLKSDFKNYEAKFLCKDASLQEFPLADKILVDAPCSSLGTIQKNPDIKWKKIDLDKLAESQFKILQNMSKNLKSGGTIVYSTCSISNKENFRVVQRFLDLNRNFKIDNASNYIDKKFVDKEGCLNIFPPKHKIEGVFAARLIKG